MAFTNGESSRGKIPYSITMKDGSPFVFAGLWEGWKSPATWEWLHTYTIIANTKRTGPDPHEDASDRAARGLVEQASSRKKF